MCARDVYAMRRVEGVEEKEGNVMGRKEVGEGVNPFEMRDEDWGRR